MTVTLRLHRAIAGSAAVLALAATVSAQIPSLPTASATTATAAAIADPTPRLGGTPWTGSEADQIGDSVAYIQNFLPAAIGECTGVLVAPEWVATAKHCLPSFSVTQQVFLGRTASYDRTLPRDAQPTAIAVTQTVAHSRADIALLKLATPSTITPAPLAQVPNDSLLGQAVTVVGWGSSSSPYQHPGIQLPAAPATVTDMVSYLAADLDHPMIRVTLDSGTSEAGDSGSPLVYNGQIIGLLHGGADAQDAVYVDVAQYATWIRDAIAIGGNPPTDVDNGSTVGDLLAQLTELSAGSASLSSGQ